LNCAATENRRRKRIRTAAQFKDLAKRASAAARAATAAAALKHGPDESADGAREEAIARAVRRAVDAALARAGIEVMKRLHPRE
jgi:KaiC/GvpD/RAD55 family RecA-like ATPase